MLKPACAASRSSLNSSATFSAIPAGLILQFVPLILDFPLVGLTWIDLPRARPGRDARPTGEGSGNRKLIFMRSSVVFLFQYDSQWRNTGTSRHRNIFLGF